MREKISFLRGEETEETAAATRRVIRLTTVDPQMDIKSKFTLSPAKGTTADARRNKGSLSRSLDKIPIGVDKLMSAPFRVCRLMSHVFSRCQ